MQEEITWGQIWGVGGPVMAPPGPARHNPGAKDTIQEIHSEVGCVDGCTVLQVQVHYSPVQYSVTVQLSTVLYRGCCSMFEYNQC